MAGINPAMTRQMGAGVSIAVQHRRPRQFEMLQQIDERLEPLLAIGIDVHAAVVEEAAPRAQPDAAFAPCCGR